MQENKVIEGLDVSGSVEDIKHKILEELGTEGNVEQIALYNGCTLLDDDTDVAELCAQSTLMAFINPVGDRKLAKFKCASDDIWIVTGNNWNFKKYEVKKNETKSLDIKCNSVLKQSHKFAVVRKEPSDGVWIGARYSLEDDHATVHVENGTVSVSSPAFSGHKVLEPEDEKTYDSETQAAREKKVNTAIAVASVLLTVVAMV